MKSHVSGTKQYFDETAARFDAIYSVEKPWRQNILDVVFRKTVNQRYELIMADLPRMAGERVLDVGTGSGRYAVELAVRGAERDAPDALFEFRHRRTLSGLGGPPQGHWSGLRTEA
jgi:ubiquinone/menaquinone biosynthesis C-methylase UbiE